MPKNTGEKRSAEFEAQAGKGRPKGTKNKLTQTVKEAIEVAFHQVGGSTYLAKMAVEEPKAFMSLLGKVIPQQINASLSGDGPIVFERRDATIRAGD